MSQNKYALRMIATEDPLPHGTLLFDTVSHDMNIFVAQQTSLQVTHGLLKRFGFVCDMKRRTRKRMPKGRVAQSKKKCFARS